MQNIGWGILGPGGIANLFAEGLTATEALVGEAVIDGAEGLVALEALGIIMERWRGG